MSDLETLLHDAAEADTVSFDHEDVRRGMRQRQRTRMAIGAAALVLVVALGAVLVGQDAQDAGVASQSGMVGALTIDELTADRWVPVAYSAITTGADGAFVEFGDDGAFAAVFGCELVTARWSVEDDDLRFDDIDSSGCEDGEAEQTVEFAALLQARPVAERFDTADTLSLRAGEDFIAFRRFDRVGVTPTDDELAGSWRADGGDAMSFDADGTVEVAVKSPQGPAFPDAPDEPCVTSSRYRIDGDVLVLDEDFSNGVECVAGDGGAPKIFGGLPFQLSASPRARVEGNAPNRILWLSTEYGVTYATEVPGASKDDASDGRSAKDIVEAVMDDVFGVSAVTMAAEDLDGLTVLTLEVGQGAVEARVEGDYGSFTVRDIASPGGMTFVGPADSTELRVEAPEAGRLTVRGIAGGDEPRSDGVVFTQTFEIDGAGTTEFFDPGSVRWVTAELVTERGPTLYLLARR
jgi:hypothetical protein